jgi:hypothetical protein
MLNKSGNTPDPFFVWHIIVPEYCYECSFIGDGIVFRVLIILCRDKLLEPCLQIVSPSRFLTNIELRCVGDNRTSRRVFGVVFC